MSYKLELIETKIIPTNVTLCMRNYKIHDIYPVYHIPGYTVALDENDNIMEIYVDSIHPNAHPETKLYCCPVPIKKMKLWVKDYRSIDFIEKQLLSKFYLDSSFFSYEHIKYAMRFLIKTDFDTDYFL